jgi:BirA family biotin operon repressor/biotin-[acetyl-CoA-carboxylase] ligase
MINVLEIKNFLLENYNHKIDCHIFETINSTQTFLQKEIKLRQGVIDICIASSQSSGKGQRNNTWSSPKNTGLWVSVGSVVSSIQHPLALSIAADIAKIIEQENIKVQLKWPNDILIENKKCAGILLNIKTTNQQHEVIIGVGINIYNNKALPNNATFLTKHATLSSPNYFCAKVISAIANRLKYNTEDWLEYWNNNLYLKNKSITIKTNEMSYSGVLTKISSDGAIILNEKNKFYSGSLTKN